MLLSEMWMSSSWANAVERKILLLDATTVLHAEFLQKQTPYKNEATIVLLTMLQVQKILH